MHRVTAWVVRLSVAGACAASASHARAGVEYRLDDGTAELAVGWGDREDGDGATSFFFANRFAAAPGGEMITSISVAYGSPDGNGSGFVTAGRPVTLILFRDQAGGETPDRPVLLRSAAATVASPGTDTFVTVPITPTAVSGNFFVGVHASPTGVNDEFPIAFDRTDPQGRSFAAFFNDPVPTEQLSALTYDPDNTTSDPITPDSNRFLGVVNGNFLVRAAGSLPGDANDDDVVNLADFGVLRQNFGRSGAGVGWGSGDFDGSGTVNLADFGILRANFGRTAAPAAAAFATVPEPSAAAGLIVLALAGTRRRARRRHRHGIR